MSRNDESLYLAYIDTGGYDIFAVAETEELARKRCYRRWHNDFVKGQTVPTGVEIDTGRRDIDAVDDWYGISVMKLDKNKTAVR